MTAEIRIRKANEGDIPELVDLIKTAMAHYAQISGIPTVLDSQRETEVDVRRHIEEDTVLVAEGHGCIVGTARLSLNADGTAYFSRFAVAHGRRQSGIGKMLLMVAADLLRDMGAREVLLHTAIANQALVGLYCRQGFELVSVAHDRGYARGLFRKKLRED